MQVLEGGLDRSPSSDFVTRAELRDHFVIIQTLFSQLKNNISSMLQTNQGNSQPFAQPSFLDLAPQDHLHVLSTILNLIIPKYAGFDTSSSCVI